MMEWTEQMEQVDWLSLQQSQQQTWQWQREVAAALEQRIIAKLKQDGEAERQETALLRELLLTVESAKDIEQSMQANLLPSSLRPMLLQNMWAQAAITTQAEWLHAWSQAEQQPVSLADGSTVPLSEAEKILASKEKTQPFLPLRKSMQQWHEQARDVPARLEKAYWRIIGEHEAGDAAEVRELRPAIEGLQALQKELQAIIRTSADVLGACDAATLQWAMDLPDEQGGYSDEAILTQVRHVRQAASPWQTRSVLRFLTPRAAVGAVWGAGRGPVRVASVPCTRAQRYLSQLQGYNVGIALALWHNAEITPLSDDEGRLIGTTLFLGLLDPVVRRATLQEPLRQATEKARVLRAALTLSLGLTLGSALGLLQ